jgi:hypothetical protein
LGAPGTRPPLKLEKIWFFGVKSWFFPRNTQKISHLPPLGASAFTLAEFGACVW